MKKKLLYEESDNELEGGRVDNFMLGMEKAFSIGGYVILAFFIGLLFVLFFL